MTAETATEAESTGVKSQYRLLSTVEVSGEDLFIARDIGNFKMTDIVNNDGSATSLSPTEIQHIERSLQEEIGSLYLLNPGKVTENNAWNALDEAETGFLLECSGTSQPLSTTPSNQLIVETATIKQRRYVDYVPHAGTPDPELTRAWYEYGHAGELGTVQHPTLAPEIRDDNGYLVSSGHLFAETTWPKYRWNKEGSHEVLVEGTMREIEETDKVRAQPQDAIYLNPDTDPWFGVFIYPEADDADAFREEVGITPRHDSS